MQTSTHPGAALGMPPMNGLGAHAPVPKQAKAWKAAQDFEAVALDQFLQPMFATVDLSSSPMGGGEAEKTWQSMMVSEMGKQMQRAGGIGIAQSVYTEMLRMQEQGVRPAGLPKGPVAPLGQETLP